MVSVCRVMRQAVRKRHGSTAAAWRAHFDPDLTGAVSFGKFVIVVGDCGFHGNVKCMWQHLAGEKNTISFRDLDPECAKILDEARESLVNSSGSILQAWHTIL